MPEVPSWSQNFVHAHFTCIFVLLATNFAFLYAGGNSCSSGIVDFATVLLLLPHWPLPELWPPLLQHIAAILNLTVNSGPEALQSTGNAMASSDKLMPAECTSSCNPSAGVDSS